MVIAMLITIVILLVIVKAIVVVRAIASNSTSNRNSSSNCRYNSNSHSTTNSSNDGIDRARAFSLGAAADAVRSAQEEAGSEVLSVSVNFGVFFAR